MRTKKVVVLPYDRIWKSDFEGINAYLPRTDNEKDEVFVYNEETRKIISNLWSKIKIVASNAQ